ncbi:MAG: AAA family ATPase [Desulfobacteraceae bacterium]|nr:AAA family ATPase [Desulfobacteraceae bacterium]
MYTEFYGFKEKPFNLVPNPSYLFLSDRHQNALTFLEYGLTEKVGFVMLTGEIGMGKTTLVRYLLNQIESDMDVAVIFNTNVQSNELISLILAEFEIKHEDGISKSKALEALFAFLIKKYAAGRKVLLIIDEAQNLSEEALEEIRMMSNLQTDEEMLLQIMIVGQPELKNKIIDPKLEQFAQRIAVSYHLSAMNLEETEEYVEHRIEKAGGPQNLFSSDAINKIFEASTGIPRTINLLSDAALVYGYADEKKEIDVDTINSVVEDKGGMGVFTKSIMSQHREDSSLPEAQAVPLEELTQRIESLEDDFRQLKESYPINLDEIQSRADFCRDEMVEHLRSAYIRERNENSKLTLENGKLKERYSQLIKEIRK